jgi:molybdopterin/thiamine biosynthesis adenylyltransferase
MNEENYNLTDEDVNAILNELNGSIDSAAIENSDENPTEQNSTNSAEDNSNESETPVAGNSTEDSPNEDSTTEEPVIVEPVMENIPLNNDSTMNENRSRFSGAPWFNAVAEERCLILGAGGIGSWTAYHIAKLGTSICQVDNDRVSAQNLAGQLFTISDIGNYKVSALGNLIQRLNDEYKYSGREVRLMSDEQYDRYIMPITISCVDNMEARKKLFRAWKRHEYRALFLDGRLSADTLQVFCITGQDEAYMKEYEEKWLFSDAEADEGVCSFKQTSYMACMIGSIITNLFINYVANRVTGDYYDLPFFIEYNAPYVLFKTQK